MNEVLKPSLADYIEMLPKGCRGCSLARFTLEQMGNTDQDVTVIIENIRANCSGWKSDENPHESVLAAEGNPAFSLSKVIDENCPYVPTFANEN